ncbi:unnamed protein product [Rotaria sp. Silwood1]|nr:unnamed protein product [Rotaria sp. Silwood1]CAF1597410.1 unnamed protein product [Rotaria sp. Silwood1]CAF3641457.1 unnamed protein product [Rotaria sp. Silwood1]CAF3724262.1 unnamed protein product [Rotaria sp. Silwood1]CAF3755998.1 unnamed protein product [Rotaria sp. Silwood1]
MVNLPTNVTLTNELSTDDKHGAMIYILGVLIWYAIGFCLILMNNIVRRKDHLKNYNHSNIYQSTNDLYEQKIRNDILIELKDEDKRKKLWEIYFNTKQIVSSTVE